MRAHLTEPGGNSLQSTDDGVICHLNLDILALEPSRTAVITRLVGVGIEIHDWSRNRSVVANTTEEGTPVRMFHKRFLPD